MILRFSLLAVLLFIGRISSGSDLKYRVADIPNKLLKDAKAVVRENETIFEISSKNSAVAKIHYAVTILNNNGIDLSILKEGYNKFSSVKKIKTALYDQYGKLIRTGLNAVIQDEAAFDGYSLYNDYRIKVFDPKYATIPFTVEYSFEIEFNGLLSYPEWSLYDDYNIATEKSHLRIITPMGFKFRYFERNLPEPCDIRGKDNKVIFSWNIAELQAIRKEPFCQSLSEFTPAVYLAPNDFEIGGYDGNCETWTNFGEWIKRLGENKNILNSDTQQKIKSLVEGVGPDSAKVRILYKYLQNKVRYVSIQQGLGGWQPIDAASVDKYSYGDCKALANYMKSLLDIVGIKSFYTLIRAGESAPPLIREFPSNRFNHAIVCVPVDNDTIWLECTDQQIPFGFLGTFTDNRKALIIKETGGVIVNTREYSIADNSQIRYADIKISADGTAQSSLKTTYKGLKYDKLFGVLRMDNADKKKFINSKINAANTELLDYDYKEIKSRVPSIVEELDLNILDYATISGNRIIFRPNLISRLEEILVRTAQRTSPINVRRAYTEYDSITYILPGRYKSAIKPNDFSLESPFGKYELRYMLNDNKLTYIRSYKMYKGVYPKTDFESFLDFFEKIQTEDNRQIALDRL
jgi:hypothetical protein